MEQNMLSRKLTEVVEDKDFEAWIRNQNGVFQFPVYPETEPNKEDISVMELSVRLYNCLERAGFTTVASLMNCL